jgi:small subunit ribosomal protein S11
VGKKRLATKTTEELIAERERVESAVTKEFKVAAKKRLEKAKIYISSSYNNTIMTLTDMQGNTLAWVSAGSVGFKGTKKATPFAASKVAEAISQIVKRMGIPSVEVYVKGIGSGRDSAIRSLASHGLEIEVLKDITPIPHNGCRPPKVRRV